MTTLSKEPATSGLPRCLDSAAGAEQQLDRISTRTTGQTQREATATVEAIIERVRTAKPSFGRFRKSLVNRN